MTLPAAIILQPGAIYTSEEVAAWLRHPVEWWYKNRAAYEKKRGFPKPISPRGQPRWSGAALLAWDRTAHEYQAAIANQSTGGNLLDLRTEALKLAARKRSGAGSAA